MMKMSDPSLRGIQPSELQFEPTKIDIQASDSLAKYVDEMYAPSRDHLILYQNITRFLKDSINQFTQRVRAQKKVPYEMQSQLFVSGSYKLDVFSAKSDIDFVCLSPKEVRREDFFNILAQILKSNVNCFGLVKIEHTYVPLIKLKYRNKEIDLSFATLPMETIPEDIDISSDKLIDGMDHPSRISINSLRVNSIILKLVPNIDHFRLLLKLIRIWAYKKGIYGNIYGYFGGVNLAIMAAYICQRYPNVSPAMLVFLFFTEMSEWEWPRALYINTPNKGTLTSWDQKNEPFDVMPIITPAYPALNSLRSANKSTKARIVSEMKKAAEMMGDIIVNKVEWKSLCADHNFFNDYTNFLHIKISAPTQQEYTFWNGIVASKVRILATKLENEQFCECSPLFPCSFDRIDGKQQKGSFFIGMSILLPKNEYFIDLTPFTKRFITDAEHSEDRKPTWKITITNNKRKEIPEFCFPRIKAEICHTLKVKTKENDLAMSSPDAHSDHY